MSAERFRGIRIFDISNLKNPKQVAAVQTCRGSHTHTLVPSKADPTTLYVYGSGTGNVRSGEELAGCSGLDPKEDPNSALFSIDVIKVPLKNPEKAAIVGRPRLFADEATGAIAGLWPGGTHGEGTQRTSQTNQCHDITVMPEAGLAAGACSGNGILMDISDPASPKRLDYVADKNFAYWHSATFNNTGTLRKLSTQPLCRLRSSHIRSRSRPFHHEGSGETRRENTGSSCSTSVFNTSVSQQRHQVRHQRFIRRRHRIVAKPVRSHPGKPGMDLRIHLALPFAAHIQRHQQMEIGIAVTRERKRGEACFPNGYSQLLRQFPDQRFFRTLTRLDLAAGKFPKPGHRLAGRPLGDEHAAVGIDEGAGNNKNQSGAHNRASRCSNSGLKPIQPDTAHTARSGGHA